MNQNIKITIVSRQNDLKDDEQKNIEWIENRDLEKISVVVKSF